MPFGLNQRSNPTPAPVSRTCDMISGICAALITSIQPVSFILGTIGTISMVIKPYFGVQVNAPVVKTEDVKEIETKDKP